MVGPSVTKQRWFHEDYDYKQVLYIVLKRILLFLFLVINFFYK